MIEYGNDIKKMSNTIPTANNSHLKGDFLNVGIIGSGNFTKNIIIPMMIKTKKYHLRAISSTGGTNISEVKSKYTFDYYSND